MIILKTPFCKILTQNVLISPLNYFFSNFLWAQIGSKSKTEKSDFGAVQWGKR